jgi:hypothetical protein
MMSDKLHLFGDRLRSCSIAANVGLIGSSQTLQQNSNATASRKVRPQLAEQHKINSVPTGSLFCGTFLWNRLLSSIAMCMFCVFMRIFPQRLSQAYAILMQKGRSLWVMFTWMPGYLKS